MSLRIALSVLALSAVPAFAVADPAVSTTTTEAAAAVAANPQAAPAAAQAAKPEEKKICKRAGATGSRTDNNKKICLTKKQWRDLERAS